MTLERRAAAHAALADRRRLAVVDVLARCDLTPGEVARRIGMSSNLTAHHLRVLEETGLVERRPSEGDRRRRYVVLRRDRLLELVPALPGYRGRVLFVCSHNSARSQFAAALWHDRTGCGASSAGRDPARAVHPLAIEVGSELGVDLTGRAPRGYDAVWETPDLIVSVCDRAGESGVPFTAPRLHWSVPDPVRHPGEARFREAFVEIVGRVEALAGTSDATASSGPPDSTTGAPPTRRGETS